jgi:hypothetical protein
MFIEGKKDELIKQGNAGQLNWKSLNKMTGPVAGLLCCLFAFLKIDLELTKVKLKTALKAASLLFWEFIWSLEESNSESSQAPWRGPLLSTVENLIKLACSALADGLPTPHLAQG